MIRVVAFVLLMMSGPVVRSQSVIDFSYESFGLENDTVNVVQNNNHLDVFYQTLYELKTNQRQTVSVVHIGDSHIQGDYLTEPIRRNIQYDFGNAGRGFIVAGRVAGTNESFNIRTRSNVAWDAKRCVHPEKPLPIGLGGITISTTHVGEIDIAMTDPFIDYSFGSVRLFYLADSLSFDFVVTDTAGHILGAIVPDGNYSFSGKSNLPYPASNIRLKTIQRRPGQTHATIFGLSLENGNNGVLYHSIGVNGARYKHYNAAESFSVQTAALAPSLFILSLGTNEALDYPRVDKELGQQLDKLVTALQKENPDAHFIFSTPPVGLLRKRGVNPGLEVVRQQIIRYAVENGFAFWDLYKVLGGAEGVDRWKETGLLRPDGVHFTKQGYAYQANLFYHALLKGYNQYVLRLRP